MRNYLLERQYGITSEDYARMLKSQSGKCAICGKKPKGSLHVDHCHETQRIRKLLCVKCNMALGVYEANRDKFEKYLRITQES